MLYRKLFKRVFDFVLSALAIVILSPFFLIISLCIKVEDPGPVFFRQKRFGINRSFFNIAKFRSMKVDTPHDVPTHLLEDPDRWITSIGKFLRRTSLDELPQLFQIFTGKMSFVGPRPALWNQLDLVELRDRYSANAVTPGLTGWAQINGRDSISLEEKARLDGEYARNIGFFFDLKIIFLTGWNVLTHKDVVEGGTGTLDKENKK